MYRILLLLLTLPVVAYAEGRLEELYYESTYTLCKGLKKAAKKKDLDEFKAHVAVLEARRFNYKWCTAHIRATNTQLVTRNYPHDLEQHPVTDWMRHHGHRLPPGPD